MNLSQNCSSERRFPLGILSKGEVFPWFGVALLSVYWLCACESVCLEHVRIPKGENNNKTCLNNSLTQIFHEAKVREDMKFIFSYEKLSSNTETSATLINTNKTKLSK